MLDQCFVSISPLWMILLAVIIASVAIAKIYSSFKGEKTAFFVITLFLAMTAVSFIFMPCWAFTVSILEAIIAFYLASKKLVVEKVR
jgi:NADH:ubiquinone oxidoreductase subunit K